MCRLVFVISVYVLHVLSKCEAARILALFPAPSISHQVVFRPLTQGLAKLGHEVTIITTDPVFENIKPPANLTEIDVHNLSYEVWRKEFLKTATGKKGDLLLQIKVIYEILNVVIEKILQTDEVQEILRKPEDYFDLLLIEACARPALVLSHVFKAPVIQVSSFSRVFGNYEAIGAPVHPILYPTNIRQKIYNITFWEKLTELYNHYAMLHMIDTVEVQENEMLKRNFGPDVPTLHELSNNIDMLFLNIHPIFEGNHPVPKSVIHVWGLHQKPVKDLPEDLKYYLDSSKNGVIYMSFGTNVKPSLLPKEKIELFLRVFSQLPYDILWKWDNDELLGKPANVRIGKWFPQSDLLRHPKVKLFITQGGLQSTDEAITAGVPLVGIPMLGDQWFNTEKYVYLKIGVKLDMGTLSEDIFGNAINTVIADDSYRRNIEKLRTLFLDQPMRPLDNALWWTEYVIRHGGAKHLRSPAANISWTEYLELELILTLVLGLSVVVSMTAIAVYILCRLVSKTFRLTTKLKAS